MAKGKGRGWGRPSKITITTFGSSVATRSRGEFETDLITPLSKIDNQTTGIGATADRSGTTTMKLQLSDTLSSYSIQDESKASRRKQQLDLNEIVTSATNGTVHPNLIEETHKRKQKRKEVVDALINLFVRNRSVENGMSLSCIPPIYYHGWRTNNLVG